MKNATLASRTSHLAALKSSMTVPPLLFISSCRCTLNPHQHCWRRMLCTPSGKTATTTSTRSEVHAVLLPRPMQEIISHPSACEMRRGMHHSNHTPSSIHIESPPLAAGLAACATKKSTHQNHPCDKRHCRLVKPARTPWTQPTTCAPQATATGLSLSHRHQPHPRGQPLPPRARRRRPALPPAAPCAPRCCAPCAAPRQRGACRGGTPL